MAKRKTAAEKAAARRASATTTRTGGDDAALGRELTREEKKAAGRTEAQQQMREYHETTFQTQDPVSGEERDLDAPHRVARLDRGETVEDLQDDDGEDDR